MSWLAICDRAPMHAKVVFVGNEAYGAWTRMTAWSAGEGLDGFIPDHMAIMFAGKQKVLDKLCTPPPGWKSPHGLLERVAGGYQAHDFHDYNPTAAEQAARKAQVSQARSEAGRKGAATRWQTRSSDDGKPDGNCHGKTMADDGPHPQPHRDLNPPPLRGGPPLAGAEVVQLPTPAKPAAPPRATKPRAPSQASACPPSSASREEVLLWCSVHKIPDPDVNVEVAKMLDWHRSKGQKRVDWEATWRNWHRRAIGYAAAERRSSPRVQPGGGDWEQRDAESREDGAA